MVVQRGSDPFSAFYPAALVGAARALVMSGNAAASLQAYREFLDGWNTADPDVPVLREASEENEKLLSSRAGSAQSG